jgi:hypothetical protein
MSKNILNKHVKRIYMTTNSFTYNEIPEVGKIRGRQLFKKGRRTRKKVDGLEKR